MHPNEVEYLLSALDPITRADTERSLREQDWAPPGGTSTNQARELGHRHHAAVTAALTERIDDRPDMWIKLYNGDTTVTAGYTDDPHSGYHVQYGLEHRLHTAPDNQRSFAYLAYDHEPPDGTPVREENIGRHWFPAPYATDAALIADHLLMWLDAHRRTTTTPDTTD